MSEEEVSRLMNAAIGRLLRLGSRPAQPGDEMEYEALRAAVMDRALPAMREAGDPLARQIDAEIAMRQDRRRRAASW